MKPLLAAKFDLEHLDEQVAKLEYPVICSPKVDGIRVLCHPELGAVTRKLKPVPNRWVREALSDPRFAGFDGEVTVGPPHSRGAGDDVFNRTTCIMAKEGQPDFTYHVFDDFTDPDRPYWQRQAILGARVEDNPHSFLTMLECRRVEHPSEISDRETGWIVEGYEGLMLRHMNGRYKYNRSTLREQILIKLKRVEDAEGVIVGYEPRYRNNNQQERDALGYSKRSSHQENLVALPMLGKWIVKSSEFTDEFGVGSGFDHNQASQWWEQGPQSYLGRTITFRYQKTGTIDKPRFPIFRAFRED